MRRRIDRRRTWVGATLTALIIALVVAVAIYALR